jgi:hypothetical protein
MDALALPQAGERLGPYELIAPLGVGGMSEVHRALDTRLGREVAVKILDFAAAGHPERLRLFEHEARAASAIEHPAIVAIHDVGHEGDIPYVVMELVEGETLQRRLLRGRLPQRKALEIAIQMGHGLAAAHARGILHNDLKPANLILTRDGRVKILDFGLAGLRGGGAATSPDGAGAERETPTQALFGTPGYIAPERIEGAAPDARSDVFSLGAVLYEMLSGVPAFPGESTAEVISATTQRDPPPIEPPLAPPVERVVLRALEKDPGQRFQSTSDLAYALEAVSSVTGAPVAFDLPRKRRWARWVLAGVGAAVLLGLGLGAGHLLWDRPLPSFQRLTFRPGSVSSARFLPDGRTIVFSAAWNGDSRVRLYTTRTDVRGATELPAGMGDVGAVSATGELAFFPDRAYPTLYDPALAPGETLARAPVSGGGAPREVLAGVIAADWSPVVQADGLKLAVVRDEEGQRHLEFPIGNVLYESAYGIRAPRFSPDGSQIAFLEGSRGLGERVSVIDLAGHRKVLAEGLDFLSETVAWSPDASEIWFSAESVTDHARYGSWRPALRAVSLSGRQRTLLRLPEYLILKDVARDGRVLLTAGSIRSEVIGKAKEDPLERNLSWHEGSGYTEVSRDGRLLLFFEQAEVATYLRPMSGGPATRIAETRAIGLSPDNRWVVSMGSDQYSGRLVLLPTAAGDPRTVDMPQIVLWSAQWFADGKRLLLSGNEREKLLRAWVVPLEGGQAHAITPEGIGCWLLSPDEKTAACARPGGEGFLFDVDGGQPRPIPGFRTKDHLREWSADGRSIYVSEGYARPPRILRLDLATGRRELWHEFTALNPIGLMGTVDPAITRDGSAWAYSVLRHLNDLYIVEGLR